MEEEGSSCGSKTLPVNPLGRGITGLTNTAHWGMHPPRSPCRCDGRLTHEGSSIHIRCWSEGMFSETCKPCAWSSTHWSTTVAHKAKESSLERYSPKQQDTTMHWLLPCLLKDILIHPSLSACHSMLQLLALQLCTYGEAHFSRLFRCSCPCIVTHRF